MAKHPLSRNAPGFYLYEILVGGIVRYIGKGCGERAKEHERTARRIIELRKAGKSVKTSRFYNRLAKAISAGSSIKIAIRGIWDVETVAKDEERKAIASAPRNQLWNTLPGGEGFDSAFIKKLWNDPAYRDKMTLSSRTRWTNPEYRAAMTAVMNSPERRIHMSQVLTEALSDPAVRGKMSARKVEAWKIASGRKRMMNGLALSHANPKNRERSRRRLIEMWADPERRAASVAKFRKFYSSPEGRAAHAKRRSDEQTPERRQKTSEHQKKLWSDPIYKEAQLSARAQAKAMKQRLANAAHINVDLG